MTSRGADSDTSSPTRALLVPAWGSDPLEPESLTRLDRALQTDDFGTLVLAGGSETLQGFEGPGLEPWRPEALGNATIQDLAPSAIGTLVATDRGLFRCLPDGCDPVHSTHFDSDLSIQGLFPIEGGGAWIASTTKLYWTPSLAPTAFEADPVPRSQGSWVRDVLSVGDGFLVATNKGAFRILRRQDGAPDLDSWTPVDLLPFGNPLCDGNVAGCATPTEKRVDRFLRVGSQAWALIYLGSKTLVPHRWNGTQLEEIGVPPPVVYDAIEFRSTIWLGTSAGLWVCEPGSPDPCEAASPEIDAAVLDLEIVSDELWAVTPSGVSRIGVGTADMPQQTPTEALGLLGRIPEAEHWNREVGFERLWNLGGTLWLEGFTCIEPSNTTYLSEDCLSARQELLRIDQGSRLDVESSLLRLSGGSPWAWVHFSHRIHLDRRLELRPVHRGPDGEILPLPTAPDFLASVTPDRRCWVENDGRGLQEESEDRCIVRLKDSPIQAIEVRVEDGLGNVDSFEYPEIIVLRPPSWSWTVPFLYALYAVVVLATAPRFKLSRSLMMNKLLRVSVLGFGWLLSNWGFYRRSLLRNYARHTIRSIEPPHRTSGLSRAKLDEAVREVLEGDRRQPRGILGQRYWESFATPSGDAEAFAQEVTYELLGRYAKAEGLSRAPIYANLQEKPEPLQWVARALASAGISDLSILELLINQGSFVFILWGYSSLSEETQGKLKFEIEAGGCNALLVESETTESAANDEDSDETSSDTVAL